MSDWFDIDDDENDVFQLPDINDIPVEKLESAETQKFSALEERLQTNSSLNSRSSPSVDEKVFNKIVTEIATVITEIIPNATIKGIGPAFHECGSFLNFAIDEKTSEIQSVWFFFSLAVFICDVKGNEIPNINELLLQLWIKKIQIKLHDDGIAQHSDIVLKQFGSSKFQNSYKLIFEHKHTPAKVTVTFCAPEALKRSQLIKMYTRLCPNMIQVGYLYHNIIMTNPDLQEFSNSSLCYLIIHFLQQTERIGILRPNSVQNSFDLQINESLSLSLPTPKPSSDSVAYLCYGFAKFYSSFNFEIFIIDIEQKELCFWAESDKAANKNPIGIRCGFTGRNLAKQISPKSLETFIQKMKEIVVAFENGTEAAEFPADIEEFAKKPLPPKTKK